MEFDLNRLKGLTTDQYDQARAKALERTQARIGSKPHRADFERELGRLWTVLDLIALLVFGAALLVSSVHIISHMGKLAAASYTATAQAQAGTVISRDFFVAVHQWMLIPLAEGSMILFLVMFGLSKNSWRRWVYFVLALAAVVFVIVANWQSGIGVLESLLPPAFTIGIGLKLEHLIVQGLKRRESVTGRYLEALHVWENASQDATKHPDYVPILRQELWARLAGLSSNKDFRDAPAGFKALAVRRELERDTWAYEGMSGGIGQMAAAPVHLSSDDSEKREAAPAVPLPVALTSNGNGRH
jgi:hypothetical protein